MSRVFLTVEGVVAIDAEYPIRSREGKFLGSVCLVFKPGTLLAEIIQPRVKDFEKTTGVRVALETYDSNEEMPRRLHDRPGYYDLIIPSDYMVESLIADKALHPLELGRIKGWININRRFQSPYFDPGGATRGRVPASHRNAKYSVPFLWGTTGIAYDRTKVKPPPSRWSDLWRPELSGHLVVVDDSREMMGLTLLILGYGKNDGVAKSPIY